MANIVMFDWYPVETTNGTNSTYLTGATKWFPRAKATVARVTPGLPVWLMVQTHKYLRPATHKKQRPTELQLRREVREGFSYLGASGIAFHVWRNTNYTRDQLRDPAMVAAYVAGSSPTSRREPSADPTGGLRAASALDAPAHGRGVGMSRGRSRGVDSPPTSPERSRVPLATVTGPEWGTLALRILVLGGDGYLGWPTAMAFSRQGHRVPSSTTSRSGDGSSRSASGRSCPSRRCTSAFARGTKSPGRRSSCSSAT